MKVHSAVRYVTWMTDLSVFPAKWIHALEQMTILQLPNSVWVISQWSGSLTHLAKWTEPLEQVPDQSLRQVHLGT